MILTRKTIHALLACGADITDTLVGQADDAADAAQDR
jgi:hypothetical protein